ncbi:hypothetical protein [Desulfovibrio sp. JC022]|uniref:hypothetical protein n=1 Tax=Desulfovibrio sp. JC022 TaxID=2593642 RepID=UPI0013D7AE6E|nr:hypothetical protein [Desulfovibrio sp. JC022]NDV24472.1 hypothetical protein [Desulfovibrio sp. JC022]
MKKVLSFTLLFVLFCAATALAEDFIPIEVENKCSCYLSIPSVVKGTTHKTNGLVAPGESKTLYYTPEYLKWTSNKVVIYMQTAKLQRLKDESRPVGLNPKKIVLKASGFELACTAKVSVQ